MQRLISTVVRVAVWAGLGAAIGFVLVLVYEVAFTGGALTFQSPNAVRGAGAGAVIGGLIGFFKRV